MTTQKEALKLARQLLWRYRHETPIGNQPHMICQEVDEAFERIDEALAQPEQEPVAWMSPNKESFVHAEDVGNSVPNWTDYYTIPLYTTPPQRKPLTDEMTKQMHERCDSYEMRGAFVDGWLSSEAAHGIKE